MEREILMTFKNGGKMYKLLPVHEQFLKSIKLSDLTGVSMNTNMPVITLEFYKHIIHNILKNKRYNSGQDQAILNQLRLEVLNHRKNNKP